MKPARNLLEMHRQEYGAFVIKSLQHNHGVTTVFHRSSSRRFLSLTIPCVLTSLLATETVFATLVIDVVGTSGSGQTAWVFSGSSTTADAGVIRTAGAGAGFNNEDTTNIVAPNDGDFIADTGLQDVLFVASGNAAVTIGGSTELITAVFLDDDSPITVVADDFGFRTENPLSYTAGQTISWTGSLTLALDRQQLNIGIFTQGNNATGTAEWVQEGDMTVSISEQPVDVDAPGGLALMIAGLAALGMRRRRDLTQQKRTRF